MIERNPERLLRLSSREELAEKVNRLRKLGPRETGNAEHVSFVDDICKEVKSLDLKVERDTLSFNRWSVPGVGPRCALMIHRPQGENLMVPVASPYPYSGRTGPDGVTGPLEIFRWGHWWKDCTGKIAVIEVPNVSVPISLLLDDRGHLPRGVRGIPDAYRHPVLSSIVFGPDLAAAKAAGAIGVVAVWKGLTAPRAAGQYVPFTFSYQDIPAVWVAGKEGKELLDSARRGTRATLTLDATISRNATTDTFWAVVEGKNSNESILVITHTDGCNAVEENGAIGVLELARMFAVKSPPKRTLVFVFVTGHLRIPAVTKQATTAWLEAHRDLWSGENGGPRAVAGLVIEHLGALARPRRSSGDQVEPAVELTYATNAAMQDILENSWSDRRLGKVLIARPGLIHLGEGAPLFEKGIPAIALATVPEYLLATTKADIVDIELMHEQINAFARALLALESSPDLRRLGRAERARCIVRATRSVQLLLFIARKPTLAFHLSAFVKATIIALWRSLFGASPNSSLNGVPASLS